jgi:hypothetical protein
MLKTALPMEHLTENELIEVKSPIDRFKETWAKLPDKPAFLRQRKLAIQNPDLLQYAELSPPKGWTPPLLFALIVLFFPALLLSGLNWMVTRDGGKPAAEIEKLRTELDSQVKTEQAVIDASQRQLANIESSHRDSGYTVASSSNLTKEDARRELSVMINEAQKLQDDYKLQTAIKIQNVRAAGDGLALAHSGTPVIFSLALIFVAPLFHKTLQTRYGRYKQAYRADSYYLYYVASHGLWLNCGMVAALNLFLSGLFDGMGAIGSTVFWPALYAALLYWLLIVSKDLYRAMQLPKPRDYASPENTVLLQMHVCVCIVFVVFEAALGALAYGVYLAERAK